jgi:hypothetical protein
LIKENGDPKWLLMMEKFAIENLMMENVVIKKLMTEKLVTKNVATKTCVDQKLNHGNLW